MALSNPMRPYLGKLATWQRGSNSLQYEVWRRK